MHVCPRMSKKIRADASLVLKAVKQNWRALQFASAKLRRDAFVVLAALAQEVRAMEFAGDVTIGLMGEKPGFRLDYRSYSKGSWNPSKPPTPPLPLLGDQEEDSLRTPGCSSFVQLVVMPLLLVAMPLLLVASCNYSRFSDIGSDPVFALTPESCLGRC